MKLLNKVALITGANRGIGAGIARTLAKHGTTVIVTGRNLEQAEKVAASINASGGNALARACDVTDFDQFEQVVKYVIRTFGRLDILVNNAGVIDPIAHLDASDPRLWSKAIDVNVKGVYFGLRAALPQMKKQGFGTVINISSGAANSALEGWSHYCSSKAAAKKLTECAQAELGDTGIHVIGLSPGTVATDMMAKIRDSKLNPVSALPWDSHISVDWVGEAVAYLCGNEGKAFAGTDFSIKTDEGRWAVGLIA